MRQLSDVREGLTSGQEWVADNCVFFTRAGSYVFGTSHPESDEDYMGVTIPPIDYWVGTRTFSNYHNGELVIHGIKNYLHLAADSNPNIIEFLFINKDDPNVILWSEIWQSIVDIKDKLISKKCYHTFGGYAVNQLKSLQRKQTNKTGRLYISEQYGYDTKFAMHAVRMAEEGLELLETGNITLPRPNAQALLDIRHGKTWPVERLEEFFDYVNAIVAKMDEALVKSPLPDTSDTVFLNQFQIDLFRKVFR